MYVKTGHNNVIPCPSEIIPHNHCQVYLIQSSTLPVQHQKPEN